MDRGPPQKRNDPAKISFAGPRKTEFLPPGAPRAREVFCSGAVLSGGRALGKPAEGTGRRRAFPASRNPRPEPPSRRGGLPPGAGAGMRQGRPFAAGKPGFYANCALFTGRDYGILNY